MVTLAKAFDGIIDIPFLRDMTSEQKPSSDRVESQAGAFDQQVVSEIVGSDLSIHFLMLGNEYTGDCTYIKVGDVVEAFIMEEVKR